VGELSEAANVRVALLTRFGSGILPDRNTILQEGDLVHAIYKIGDKDRVEQIFAQGPLG
jgi:trk system potassium uptake protein TrkA